MVKAQHLLLKVYSASGTLLTHTCAESSSAMEENGKLQECLSSQIKSIACDMITKVQEDSGYFEDVHTAQEM